MSQCTEVMPQLSAYHDGEAAAGSRERIEAHLAECPACDAYLADMAGICGIFGDDPAVDPPPRVWTRVEAGALAAAAARNGRPWHWAVKAAAVAAGFVLYLLGYGLLAGGTVPRDGRQMARVQPIEQALYETGRMLAGDWPGHDEDVSFEHRPEWRLVRQMSQESKP